MDVFGKKISAEQLLRWSFLILFWGIWFGQFFLSPDDDERRRQFMIRLLPVTLTNIPLFFINTERAEPVTHHPSELMRYMLYESADAQIPLEKELDYLKRSVERQKIRFEADGWFVIHLHLHFQSA